jgi:hypothetical protein
MPPSKPISSSQVVTNSLQLKDYFHRYKMRGYQMGAVCGRQAEK